MSRDWEGDGEGTTFDYARFELNARRVVRSKVGVRHLRDLEAALLALPVRRLACGVLYEDRCAMSDGFGDVVATTPAVCAIGALALYRGIEPEALEGYEGTEETLEAGEAIGLNRTLAWVLGELNDEGADGNWTWGKESEEQRYERVLQWVRERIAAVPS